MRRAVVMVLGMHRSGTSVLAAALHHGGVCMGTEAVFRPRPSPENPIGFFEDVRFRRLNDRMLERSGHRVKDWCPSLSARPDAGRGDRLRMRRLLTRRDARDTPWGWKDPRQMLTINAWIPVIEEAGLRGPLRVALIHRDPVVVGRSMHKRGNVPTVAAGMMVWELYNRVALDSLDACGIPVTSVGYEDLVTEPAPTVRELSSRLDLDLDLASATAVVQPSLNRSAVSARAERSDLLGTPVKECVQRLEELDALSSA
jgi:hypothetical protein